MNHVETKDTMVYSAHNQQRVVTQTHTNPPTHMHTSHLKASARFFPLLFIFTMFFFCCFVFSNYLLINGLLFAI